MARQQKRTQRKADDGIMSLVVHAASQWLANHIPLVVWVVAVWSVAGYRLGGLGFFGYVLFGALAVAGKFGTDWLVWSVRQRHLYAEVGTVPPVLKVQRRRFHDERRRRATIRKQWPVACQRYEITDPDKMVPHLWRLRTDLAGDFSASVYPAKFVLKGGVEVVELSRQKIAQAVDCRDLLVRRRANGFDLTFMWSDPLHGALKVADMPRATTAGTVSFGRTVSGSAAVLTMNSHLLVVGMTGRGKSNAAHALIADYTRQKVRLNLSIIDPKGGVELHDYKPHVGILNGTLLVKDYCSSGGPESIALLSSVVERLRERQAAFEARGCRKWLPEMADEFPLEVLFVDECLQVLRTWSRSKMGKDTVMGGAMAMLCTELLAQGRAFGFVFWGLTQSGKVEDLGGARDLIPQRFCLGVSNLQAASMALGENTPGIDRAVGMEPGRGLLYLEDQEGLGEVKVALCDDADVRHVAAGKLPSGMDRTLPKNGVERLCYVYLLRDRFWRAVYVGKGFVPEGRIGHHLRGTGQLTVEQAATVDESKTEIFTLGSEREALAWERELIHRCRPYANTVHNLKNPARGQVPQGAPWQQRPAPVDTTPVQVPRTAWGRKRLDRRASQQAVRAPVRAQQVQRGPSAPQAYVNGAQRATEARQRALTGYGRK